MSSHTIPRSIARGQLPEVSGGIGSYPNRTKHTTSNRMVDDRTNEACHRSHGLLKVCLGPSVLGLCPLSRMDVIGEVIALVVGERSEHHRRAGSAAAKAHGRYLRKSKAAQVLHLKLKPSSYLKDYTNHYLIRRICPCIWTTSSCPVAAPVLSQPSLWEVL